MDIFAVFTAPGLGLAAPYLLVAIFPGLAMRLPRPGPWMTTLRRILAVALAATAVWLLWVLAAQIGREGAVAVGFFMALAVAVLAVRRLPRSEEHTSELQSLMRISYSVFCLTTKK